MENTKIENVDNEMTAVMQRIVEAENKAKQIIDSANEKASAISASISTELENVLKNNAEDNKNRVKQALAKAAEDGEIQAKTIMDEAQTEISALNKTATKNFDNAVNAIVEQFKKTV